MTACTILTITGDEPLLGLLRDALHDHNGGGSRMIVAGSMEEACSLLPMAEPRLIVVHWTRHGSHYEELNRLLWATTVLARPVPVLVIADRYHTDQATTLYRMGVTDYISRTHHDDKIGEVLKSYLKPVPRSKSQKVAATDEPARSWAVPPSPVTAQVV